MKILSVVGTRPEAIKMAPVIRELAARAGAGVDSRVCVTGQHREMLRQVMQLFEITPDYDLDVMTARQTPTQVAAAVLRGIEEVLDRERPDWVLVQGDTTTVAATALAAFYGRCSVGHVEAGLRTFNRHEPFPEEINRRVAGVLADTHFAPTTGARDNLTAERVDPSHIAVTGNTVIDALQHVAALPLPDRLLPLLKRVGVRPDAGHAVAADVATDPRLVLVTAHRRENFGAPFVRICEALRDLADEYRGSVRLVYPVHPNPNVREPVFRLLADHPHIVLVEPLEYVELVHLMKRSTLVITDSGGIQEEAPSLGVPVLVLRDVTERPEAVDAGTVRLVGSDADRITAEAQRLLDDRRAHEAMARAINPYGDGRAAWRIAQRVLGLPFTEFAAPSTRAPRRTELPPATSMGSVSAARS
ncbi:MAG TPA: UDP-N-acetylglucosamine 2-epimerase (non-hydrolyzing) [Gemmatimonadaceae bacterium]|nr:UDP-N-acetylglucosamine 2-epimerase (non-hydrolyzing) [Gemmatimonadaceae bacterium]